MDEGSAFLLVCIGAIVCMGVLTYFAMWLIGFPRYVGRADYMREINNQHRNQSGE